MIGMDVRFQRVIQLQTQFSRQSWSALRQNTVETALASSSSKLGLLAQRLKQPGPPVHVSIDRISLPRHRVAFSDCFFGKFAKNYFAKNLIPVTHVYSTELITR